MRWSLAKSPVGIPRSRTFWRANTPKARISKHDDERCERLGGTEHCRALQTPRGPARPCCLSWPQRGVCPRFQDRASHLRFEFGVWGVGAGGTWVRRVEDVVERVHELSWRTHGHCECLGPPTPRSARDIAHRSWCQAARTALGT
eukprot:1890095-Rhodomonas_salina.2